MKKPLFVSTRERRYDEEAARLMVALIQNGGHCPNCGNRVLFSTQDGDLECFMCGTIIYITRGKGDRVK